MFTKKEYHQKFIGMAEVAQLDPKKHGHDPWKHRNGPNKYQGSQNSPWGSSNKHWSGANGDNVAQRILKEDHEDIRKVSTNIWGDLMNTALG